MSDARSVPPAVSFVMPCYDEEDCLEQTAGAVLQAFASKNIPLQLVLVDNGSHDGTGRVIDELIAHGHPVTKVRVEVNIGYGNGIIQGLKQCQAPLVGYVCADGQVAPEEVVETYERARDARGQALAKVRRRFRKDSWRRKLVSIIYNFGMPIAFGGLGSLDLNASPKVFSREALQRMQLQSTDWFLDPEIMVKAKYLGLRVLERDVEGLPRQGGKSNVRYTTVLQFVKNVLRYRFGRPLREWRRSLSAMPQQANAPAAETHGRGGSSR